MSIADPTRSAAGSSADALEFETLISDLSSRFINLPPGELDREIEDAMRRVCELLRVDLAVLWQWARDESDLLTPTHAYYAGDEALPALAMRQEQYPWSREQVRAGRMFAMSSPADLPAAAAVDRETCRDLGIKSALLLPLSLGGGPAVGALGFNTLREPRGWPDLLVRRLQLVAQVFTNALARARHELDLLESEARLSLAADSAGAGLWNLDYRTGVFWATSRARAIFGYSPDEIVGMERFEASVHPEDRDQVKAAVERSGRTGEALHVEYRIILPDRAGVRWITSQGRPHLDTDGACERMMGSSIDITERKHAEAALRISEARLTAGADLAGLGFYEVDFGRGLMYADERLKALCGMSSEPADSLQVLHFWLEHLHPDDRPHVLELREKLHDGRLEQLSAEYRYLHPSRGDVWFQHLAGVTARDATGRAVRTFGVLREITDRKQAEDDLRDLGQRLIRAHEDERAMLARDLHDDLTQRLAVLAIGAGRAELAAADDVQASALRAVREGLVRLSEDVHSLAYQLHPSVLDELGLAEALRAECERLGRSHGLRASVEMGAIPVEVDKDAALGLFRVAQEALSNVIRHAGVGAASVALRELDGGVSLVVHDDGVGFDSRRRGGNKSLGLMSMRERVRLLSGRLDIESTPGQGTSIIAWVPARGGLR